MANDVGDGFFAGKKYVVAQFGGDGRVWQIWRNLKPIFQTRNSQVFLGVFTDVVHQTIKRVVGGVHSPNDLIERVGGLACGLGDLTSMRLDLLVRLIQLSSLPLMGPLRKRVVNLLRDVT